MINRDENHIKNIQKLLDRELGRERVDSGKKVILEAVLFLLNEQKEGEND